MMQATQLLPTALLLATLAGCNSDDGKTATNSSPHPVTVSMGTEEPNAEPRETIASTELATFAGGCFWCIESPFEVLPGISEVTSGYIGGHVVDPTYSAVGRGSTGHTEAVQITFDPSLVSYDDLLEVFWRQIDPTDAGGQFHDRGSQYRTGIFYHDEEQRITAQASKRALQDSGRFSERIVTEIVPATEYYVAEEYHQDYYKKEPKHYKGYRKASGRDNFVEEAWGDDLEVELKGGQDGAVYSKPSDEALRESLTDLQYRVTQEEATERAFDNIYWDNEKAGIYVDIASGEPLFSSMDKMDNGHGWPSFSRPLVTTNLTSAVDFKIGYARDEVRSKHGNSHLGHVFSDSSQSTGQRFCINSASLRFIPAGDLKKEGYGKFTPAFE
ncbi:MAG: peptide methionine sulfoxide reductase msrA/msrB [Planctomycetota bacterium]|jgi:peptide methionine sulfoxide reductase msrA/msrB